MPIILTDSEIQGLVQEAKPLPDDYREKLQLKPKRGHKERELDVTGAASSEFRLILRQSLFNALDFSVILAFRPRNTSQYFRLRRYNGKSHAHTNQIERQTFYDFHMHEATERYQASGFREDAFATPTDRYADIFGAIECLLDDCGFQVPLGDSLRLF